MTSENAAVFNEIRINPITNHDWLLRCKFPAALYQQSSGK